MPPMFLPRGFAASQSRANSTAAGRGTSNAPSTGPTFAHSFGGRGQFVGKSHETRCFGQSLIVEPHARERSSDLSHATSENSFPSDHSGGYNSGSDFSSPHNLPRDVQEVLAGGGQNRKLDDHEKPDDSNVLGGASVPEANKPDSDGAYGDEKVLSEVRNKRSSKLEAKPWIRSDGQHGVNATDSSNGIRANTVGGSGRGFGTSFSKSTGFQKFLSAQSAPAVSLSERPEISEKLATSKEESHIGNANQGKPSATEIVKETNFDVLEKPTVFGGFLPSRSNFGRRGSWAEPAGGAGRGQHVQLGTQGVDTVREKAGSGPPIGFAGFDTSRTGFGRGGFSKSMNSYGRGRRVEREEQVTFGMENAANIGFERAEVEVVKQLGDQAVGWAASGGNLSSFGKRGGSFSSSFQAYAPEPRPMCLYVPPTAPIEQVFKESAITVGGNFETFYEADITLTRSGCLIEPVCYNSYGDLGLTVELTRNIMRAGYSKPTPVQKYAMPLVFEEYDLMCCAQTGCGKTVAYLLPTVARLLSRGDLAVGTEEVPQPRCLVIAPTRELALQIHNEARKFCDGTACKVAALYGGTNFYYQKNQLCGATVIVCTMGRLIYFITKAMLDVSKVRVLVIDEADKMLCYDPAENVEALISNKLFVRENLQVTMFSATFPVVVQQLAHACLKKDHYMLAVGVIGAANSCIQQNFILAAATDKRDELLKLLRIDTYKFKAPADVVDEMYKKKTLVFVNARRFADVLAGILSQAGILATTIHADRDQQQREIALNDFRAGRTPILIATAVAERGLDIRNVDHVINYDLPVSRQEYVQRIGRTGRVGNLGVATSFFDPQKDAHLAKDLVQVLMEVHQEPPDFLARAAGINYSGLAAAAVAAPFADGTAPEDGYW